LKLTFGKLLSKFAFNCNLRHYTMVINEMNMTIPGRAVQVDPGISQLIPSLLSSAETIM